jgi:hypothetical protein
VIEDYGRASINPRFFLSNFQPFIFPSFHSCGFELNKIIFFCFIFIYDRIVVFRRLISFFYVHCVNSLNCLA